MKIPRITWEGNLASDEQLNGFVKQTLVAAITVIDGKVTLAYLNGLQFGQTSVASVKRAKELAEETLHIFVNALNARFYQEDELAIVDSIRMNKDGSDEQGLVLLEKIWTRRGLDNADRIAFIRDSLDDLHAVLEHERAQANARA